MVVITYLPSGDTCDMNPIRSWGLVSPLNDAHEIMSFVRTVIFRVTGTTAYRPLSLRGPSMSRPRVLPSRLNEWQFAQECKSVMTTWLEGSARFRIRHAMRGTALGSSGWI